MAESTEKKIRKFLQVGTLECMILCVVLAIIVGVLFITIGFWKTLLITALILVGLFIGGVTNKKEFLRTNPDICDDIERQIRENADKLTVKGRREAAQAATRAVDISAGDFEG